VRWTIHGEQPLYRSDWVTLALTDVELPSGARFDHHVVRMPRAASAVVMVDAEERVLLLRRHRFITDTWGWEIPAGGIEAGESPEAAAVRETLEETGWQPSGLRQVLRYHPTNGLSDQTFHIFVATGALHVGDPTDAGEAERIEWVQVPELRRLVRAGEMVDGLSLTGVCYALAFGELD